jgi:hypothetical protein
MFIIAVTEKLKDSDRGEAPKIQAEILGALKEEHKAGLVSSIHNNPATMYQKVNYVSFFFGFDKKL